MAKVNVESNSKQQIDRSKLEIEIIKMSLMILCSIKVDGYIRSELGCNHIKYCAQYIIVRQLGHKT